MIETDRGVLMIRERVQQLRKVMETEGIDAYIITGTDPHQSEYVCERWKTRAWISGFTGSAGTVVITADTAALWTDSRYFIQAEQQLDPELFELYKSGNIGVPSYQEFLARQLEASQVVGICDQEISLTQFRDLSHELQSNKIELTTTGDLLDRIWKDRPGYPDRPVRSIDPALTGVSWEEKVHDLRSVCRRYGADSMLITPLDEIAWTLNLRGEDIPFNPVFLSYLLISDDSVCLYCSDAAEHSSLPEGIETASYDQAAALIAERLEGSRGLYVTPETVNMEIINTIGTITTLIEGPDMVSGRKAVKHERELDGMRFVHKLDGAAMVTFLCWLEQEGTSRDLDELSLARKLLGFRSEQPGFMGESFTTIAGFRDHGAIVHYCADKDSSYPLTGDGLLILDSGGQYVGGTTDITRTLLFGEASEKQRRDYTMVLKAHLGLSRQLFPAGTNGYQLDGIARMQLWNAGLNYGHGTGHGVGHMLNVHEGPQSISPKPITVALEAGMVISNEPGLYRFGEYGIRIENLVTVVEDHQTPFGDFLAFEQLTLCPYERRLIDMDLLDVSEIEQIDRYHQRVFEQLSAYLGEKEVSWLEQKTKPLRMK
jgi:Xaa-Pro aminopeptidase